MIQKVLRQRKDGENNRSPLRPQPYFTIVWDFAEILPAMFLLGLEKCYWILFAQKVKQTFYLQVFTVLPRKKLRLTRSYQSCLALQIKSEITFPVAQ